MGTLRRTLTVLAVCCAAVSCGDDDNDNGDDGSPMATPTPSPTASAPPQIPCPTKLTYIVAEEGSDIDAGTTGLYFDVRAGDGGALSFDLACPGDFLGACGACALSGPVQSTTVVDNHRCQNATERTCATDADCPGDSCVFFFGAPVPASGGGVSVCVTNRVAGTVIGTVSPEAGSGTSEFATVWSNHLGIDVDTPCPTCNGAGFNATGTCEGGARDGEACTVHGTSTVFGNTSFDCPPNPSANVGDVDVPLNLTTGTRSMEPTESCVGGGPFTGQPCYCAGQRQPNSCTDGVCTVGADDEGSCLAGPLDQICTIETFRNCGSDSDCPRAGDGCLASGRRRECAGPTDASGVLNGPLSRTGTPGREGQAQVGVFCLGETRSAALNEAVGLPGPASVRLPTTACIADSCP